MDLVAVHDKLTKEDSGNADSEAQFRLLLLLHSIDIKLMQSSVQQLSKLVFIGFFRFILVFPENFLFLLQTLVC